MPLWLGAIAVTGIVAAGLSSAAAFLSLIGFAAAHDIAPAISRVGRDPSVSLMFSRTVMLVLGVIVLGLTYVAPPAVLAIGYFAATLFATSWGPVAILAIFTEWMTARGAMVGMLVGFVAVFILQGLVEFADVAFPIWADPVILGFGVTLLGILVGNFGQRPSAKNKEYRRSLLSVPAEDMESGRIKTTRRFILWTAAVCVIAMIVLFFVYFLPFSQMAPASI
jgi:sodium/pantothenate symporter